MKRKSNDKRVEIKKHFDKKGGHPHIIAGTIKDKYVSIGLTSSPKKGANNKNYRLEKNPLGEPKTSYAKRQGTIDKKSNYSKNSRQGLVSKKDDEFIQNVKKKSINKYLNK